MSRRHSGPSTYRVSAFAKLAGVSVRALHHYDRVGLLRPTRTAGGYRVYIARDLERLEQIVVLKFLGMPLRHITGLLRASPPQLVARLRAQRGTLERRRQLLDRGIAAIADLENSVAAGVPAEPHLYQRIMEVIAMHDDGNAWKEQYDELVSKKIERLRALSPDRLASLRSEWSALVAAINGALTEDPAGPKAQALGQRWSGLLGGLMGQPVDTAMLAGHQSSHEWDPGMASFVDKPVWDFMTRVLAARR